MAHFHSNRHGGVCDTRTRFGTPKSQKWHSERFFGHHKAITGCQVALAAPATKKTPSWLAFRFLQRALKNAPEPHSGVAGAPMGPSKMTEICKNRVFQGDTRNPFWTPKKLKLSRYALFWPPKGHHGAPGGPWLPQPQRISLHGWLFVSSKGRLKRA